MWYHVITRSENPSKIFMFAVTFAALVLEICKFIFFFQNQLCIGHKWKESSNTSRMTNKAEINTDSLKDSALRKASCYNNRGSFTSIACLVLYGVSIGFITYFIWEEYNKEAQFRRAMSDEIGAYGKSKSEKSFSNCIPGDRIMSNMAREELSSFTNRSVSRKQPSFRKEGLPRMPSSFKSEGTYATFPSGRSERTFSTYRSDHTPAQKYANKSKANRSARL